MADNDQSSKEELSPASLAKKKTGQNGEPAMAAQPSRLPFTSLSQMDADLALARTLQDQERAYLFLRMGSDASEFDSSGSGSYDDEHEDEDDDEGDDGDFEDDEADMVGGQWQVTGASLERTHRSDSLDGALFANDEAFARALQDKEDQETTALMALAGIHDWERVTEYESDSDTSQDMWQDVDPDNMSYEELVALGEAVGTQNKGLASHVIASLPNSSFVLDSAASDNHMEQCVICRHEYEEGDMLLTLPCKHKYHSGCITQWLQINKVCPVCSAEVSEDETGSRTG